MTLDEVMKSPVFQAELETEIKTVKNARTSRPLPPPGMKYRRDIIDQFEDDGQLNASYFLKHIPAIWTMQSKLPSRKREFIRLISNKAMGTFMRELDKQKQAEDAKENTEGVSDSGNN